MKRKKTEECCYICRKFAVKLIRVQVSDVTTTQSTPPKFKGMCQSCYDKRQKLLEAIFGKADENVNERV